MKRFNFQLTKVLFIAILCLTGCQKKEKPLESREPIWGEINIIPQPSAIKRLGGKFDLNAATKIIATDESSIKTANLLNEILKENYGLTLEISNQLNQENSIIFLTTDFDNNSSEENYNLKIEPQHIQIRGTEKGMFYGLQSLRQLLPQNANEGLRIPATEISDSPRFSYRGMHLDVARHFMPIEFVKKYINLISKYKYNYFHWHLTDDQGWRIEIKKHPKLTEIGSNRKETVIGKKYQPYIGDGIPVEGFYTQEQIREIVEYAKTRYVTIIPEIDMPGHTSAALAAYPQYGCKDKNYSYKVKTTWGGFPDILCPTEPTFQFVEDILGEVIDLFPNSPYIHIGGDEVNPVHWKESSFVQALKQKENLKTEKEVQSWFIRRIENFVNSRGKKIIGWDEILGEGVQPSTTIMVWQNQEAGRQAVRSKHKVIMTPSDKTYFDHPQGNPKYEPLLNLGDQVTLEDVYNFEPIPVGLSSQEASYIIGGQGCLWTEFLKKPEQVEYMAFPRTLALAEVLWSPKKKNIAHFLRRLNKELPYFDQANVNYRIPKPIGLYDQTFSNNEPIRVELIPIQNGKIHYTLDGSEPNLSSSVYKPTSFPTLEPNKIIEFKAKVFNSNGRSSVTFSAKYQRKPEVAGP